MAQKKSDTDNKGEYMTVNLPNGITLTLPENLLTFAQYYGNGDLISCNSIAGLGFDLCSVAIDIMNSLDIKSCFKMLSGIEISDELISDSSYSAVEAKVFGCLNEEAAVYSLGIILNEMFLLSDTKSLILKKIISKASHKNSYERYSSFEELQGALSVFLMNEVSRESYGVFIVNESDEIRENINTISETEAAVQVEQGLQAEKVSLESEFNFKCPHRRLKNKKVLNLLDLRKLSKISLKQASIIFIIFSFIFSSIALPMIYTREKYFSFSPVFIQFIENEYRT